MNTIALTGNERHRAAASRTCCRRLPHGGLGLTVHVGVNDAHQASALPSAAAQRAVARRPGQRPARARRPGRPHHRRATARSDRAAAARALRAFIREQDEDRRMSRRLHAARGHARAQGHRSPDRAGGGASMSTAEIKAAFAARTSAGTSPRRSTRPAARRRQGPRRPLQPGPRARPPSPTTASSRTPSTATATSRSTAAPPWTTAA
jgi:hypothetical protein